jgi:hypothetical protein
LFSRSWRNVPQNTVHLDPSALEVKEIIQAQ